MSGELKSKRTTNDHQYTAYRFINEKFPKARIPANKKRNTTREFLFKTAPKKRRFVHHYAFVCIIFVFEQK